MNDSRWPPQGSGVRKLYLAPGGLRSSPGKSTSRRSYLTNPADGLSMSFNQYGTVAISPYIPLDQRLAEEAGLTWRTSAFARPLTLSGESALHLVASSSANNTDWFAKLSDVAPNGSEAIITEGFLRASHRQLDPARTRATRPWHTNTSPTPIQPGRDYAYDLAIWPTAYQLKAGHRLQLRLTSYDFPTHLPGRLRVDPNHPGKLAFDPLPPARNTVRLGGPNPSFLRITALGATASK
jgi:putative CocE/NonD family hydrolase